MEKKPLSRASLREKLKIFGRCVSLAILISVLFGATSLSAQTKQRFTLNITNSYLSDLFLQIEKQSNISFVYNVADIERLGKKNFKCVNAELRSIIDKCLNGTELKYEITDTHVVISRRDGTSAPQQLKDRISVSGHVCDVGKEPLVGVAVRIRNSNMGVITDAMGNFNLNAAVRSKDSVTLVFSFVGMERQEVKYTGQPKINVTMKETAGMMDEVVVQTGYQTLDKRKITSAITTLKAKDIYVPSLGTIDMMLEGHVPGMVFMQNSGNIGVAPRLRIRGTSTILGNQEPLWVVDGIVMTDPVNVDPQQLNDLDFVNLLGNAISGLNPEDIEQIDILKDASATAIYGARAANGVIVVTTKQGNPGPPAVSYSFSGSFSQRPRYSDRTVNMMNSKERIDYSREMMEKGQTYGHIESWVGYEGAMRDYYEGRISYDQMQSAVSYYEGLNTDWFDLLTRDSFNQKHTISLSGGSSTFRYYASLGLNDTQGTVKGENNKTYSSNVNVSANYKKLSMRFGINASVQDKRYNPTELNVLDYAYGTSRALPAYDESGELYSYNRFYSRGDGETMRLPFNIMDEMNNSYDKSKTYTTTLTASLNYDVTKDFRIGATLSYTIGSTDQQTYYNEKSFRAATLRAEGKQLTGNTSSYHNLMPYGGELNQTKTDRSNYTIRFQASYNKSLDAANKHSISATGGFEVSSAEYDNLRQLYRGYMPDRANKMGNFDPDVYGGYYDWYYTMPLARGVRNRDVTNIVSGYATLTYDYDGRYIFNVNARADASNQFGSRSNDKILPIWSFSGRWNVKYDLFRNVEWLNSMSLRASLGIQGNMLSSESSRLIISRDGDVNGDNEYISKIFSYPNPDLKWEKTTSSNVSLDFGILSNRITASVSYFYKKTKDAFMSKRIPAVNGVRQYTINRGTIENQGLELGLNIVAINRVSKGNPEGFRWTISPNIGQTLNRLMATSSGKTFADQYTYADFLNGTIEFPDRPLNSFYSYKFTGLDPTDGRPMLYGLDEEQFGELYPTMSREEIFMNVMEYSGRRVPVFQGGFGNTFSYKRFSLSVNLSCSFGSKVRLLKLYTNVNSGYGTIAPQPHRNARRELLDRWRYPGDELKTNIPGTLSGAEFTNTLLTGPNWWKSANYAFAENIWQMYDNSNVRVVSGNYVKLQSMSLRYNMPNAWIKKLSMKSAYVSFSATNLFTICSKELKGQDPATQSGSAATLNLSNRPTYSFSLNVSF